MPLPTKCDTAAENESGDTTPPASLARSPAALTDCTVSPRSYSCRAIFKEFLALRPSLLRSVTAFSAPAPEMIKRSEHQPQHSVSVLFTSLRAHINRWLTLHWTTWFSHALFFCVTPSPPPSPPPMRDRHSLRHSKSSEREGREKVEYHSLSRSPFLTD